jgi:hypothetical protein
MSVDDESRIEEGRVDEHDEEDLATLLADVTRTTNGGEIEFEERAPSVTSESAPSVAPSSAPSAAPSRPMSRQEPVRPLNKVSLDFID